MSGGVVETLEWLKPRNTGDGGCSVYACESPAYTVLRVGGGSTAKDINASVARFCWEHFHNLRCRADRFSSVVPR